MSLSVDKTRLDAYLARAGMGTRREVKALVRAGRVRLGGEICLDPGVWIENRSVELDDVTVQPREAFVHLLVHKPVGVSCSHDEREAPLLYDLVPAEFRHLDLQAAGRLDRATSGLLVLSTDGQWIHRLSHPNYKVPKRYRIGYVGTLHADATEQCRRGLLLDGEPDLTAPSTLHLEGDGRATLVLREGRRHQVRRMIRALGGKVRALHRDRMGGYDLPPTLLPGDWLRLEEADLERLSTAINL